MRSPATPGWGGVRWCWWWVTPRHSWLRVLGAVPCHSWLGSAGRGGGRFCRVWWGFAVLCVFEARRVRVVSLLVCVSFVRGTCVGGGVGVGVSSGCVCVCVCACVVYWLFVVAGPCSPRLGLAAGVGVGVAGVCCGWSLATPGGGS